MTKIETINKCVDLIQRIKYDLHNYLCSHFLHDAVGLYYTK